LTNKIQKEEENGRRFSFEEQERGENAGSCGKGL